MSQHPLPASYMNTSTCLFEFYLYLSYFLPFPSVWIYSSCKWDWSMQLPMKNCWSLNLRYLSMVMATSHYVIATLSSFLHLASQASKTSPFSMENCVCLDLFFAKIECIESLRNNYSGIYFYSILSRRLLLRPYLLSKIIKPWFFRERQEKVKTYRQSIFVERKIIGQQRKKREDYEKT